MKYLQIYVEEKTLFTLDRYMIALCLIALLILVLLMLNRWLSDRQYDASQDHNNSRMYWNYGDLRKALIPVGIIVGIVIIKSVIFLGV